MTLYDIAFYFLALIAVGSASIVVFSRNIIYSAFSLLFTFFGVAGLYVLLSADFLAVTQLLIYVGGILVLLLFGVMLTNKLVSVDMQTGTLQTLPASILFAMTAGCLCGVFVITDWNVLGGAPETATTAVTIGEMFLTTWLLPFEIASVVLLVALVGAAMTARRDAKLNTTHTAVK
jgi:NADH-quinone oxidoreductase subunit J